MSRNSSGTYTLPTGNPVVTGTTIESTWANTTMSDIATALTDSLSRTGNGAMLAPLRVPDGSAAAPTLSFSNQSNTGFYRVGSDQLGITVGGTLRAIWGTSSFTINVAIVASGGGTYTGTHNFTGGIVTVPTQATSDDSTNAASTAFVQNVAMNAALPDQTGNAGKYVRTDGTDSSWEDLVLDDGHVSGELPVANGGTGADNAADARTNLGAYSSSGGAVSGPAYTPPQTVAFSATPAFDAALGNVFYLGALTGNVTGATISNPSDGQTINIRVAQDGTGGRTVTFSTSVKISGAIETGASRVSWIVLTYVSSAARWEGAWVSIPA